MIDWILAASLKQRAIVLLGAFVLLVVGLFAAFNLPVDAVPDITNVQVQINAEVPSLAPEEAERLVTIPMEVEMSGLPGLAERRSLTKSGLSQVTLVFEDGTDIYRARQLVAERLQGLLPRLAPGCEARMAPITTGLGEILYYTLAWKDAAPGRPTNEVASLMELRDVHEYVVKPMLRATPGVAEINAAGGHERQYVVAPRPAALAERGLTVNDLADVLSRNAHNAGGGVIQRDGQQFVIRAVARFEDVTDVGALPIRFGAGVEPIRIRDVADVVIGTAVRTGAATENGREAMLGTAMMLAGQNSRIVARRVAEALPKIEKQLPDGMELRVQYDRAELVDRTVATVRKNLVEGALLVVVVLLLLLGNWRAALIVALAIPLSFLAALIGMWKGGVSGNLMSLGAIDFGLVIDGAVVMVENVVRRLGLREVALGRRLTFAERQDEVLAAGRQVARPMFFGVVIITLVYAPILALTGVEGKMFQPMAVTVMLALGGALALSVTLMPVLCSMLLTRLTAHGRTVSGPADGAEAAAPVLSGETEEEHDNAAIRWAKRLYRPALTWAVGHPWVMVGAGLVLTVATLVGFRRLGAEFVPKLDEGSFTVMVYRTNSMGLASSLAQQLATEKLILEKVPEVTRVFSRIGTSEVATDPMPPSQADLYLFYKPQAEWRRTNGAPISKAELASVIDAAVQEGQPGQTLVFAQPIEMRFNELLEGVRADISVKVIGTDYDILEPTAAKIRDLLQQVPGTREGEGEVEFETQGRAPVLMIRAKKDMLQKYNLSAESVNQVVRSALGGEVVGSIYRGNRRSDLVVRLPEALREDMDSVRSLPVRVSEHATLPLGRLAEFETLSAVEPIAREEGHRRAALLVNLRGRDVEGWVQEAQALVSREVKLPDGYRVEFGGQFENLREAQQRLLVVVPGAGVLILVLVFLALGSFRQAILVYTGIPLAITGGVLALWLRGMPFSITAAVGFIALSGVAVLNGLVLVTQFNELRAEGRSLRLAVIVGALMRLRPVLMTALVASLGFVPMAMATGAGAEVQRPLATVVIGGIVSSTLLTLLVLPSLYAAFESGDADRAPEVRAS
jgi:heavy metal efflux system protein